MTTPFLPTIHTEHLVNQTRRKLSTDRAAEKDGALVALTTDLTVAGAEFDGTAAVTLTSWITGLAADAKVTVTGAGKVGLGTVEANVKEIDASGNTGGTTVVLAEAGDKFTGGSGNDTVTLAGGPTADVAAGTGSGDRLIVSDDAFIDTADERAKISGFEILRTTEAAAFTTDISKLSGITAIEVAGTTSTEITGLSSQTIKVIGDNVGNLTFTKTGANPGGTDELTVTLDNSVLKNGDGVDVGSVTVANIDTLNLVSTGKNLNANQSNSVNGLVNGDLEIVKITGDTDLNVTTGASSLDTVDASGFTGALTLDASAGGQVNVTGGSGKDVLTGSGNADVINGGAANDSITGGVGADLINVGTGRDVVNVTNVDGGAVHSGTASYDKVSSFSLTSEAIASADLATAAKFQAAANGGAEADLLVLDLNTSVPGDVGITVEANGTGAAVAASTTFTVNSGILTLSGSGAAAVDTLAEWVTEAAAVAATAGDALAFEFGGNTYVFAQNGAADLLVELTGVTGAASLVEVSGTTTAGANSILFADIA